MIKVKVDQVTCIGCSLCNEICNDVFEMNDDASKAKVKIDPRVSGNEERVDEAIKLCPSNSISKEIES